MTTTDQFKKQLPRNAIAAVLSFFTYTLSAVWLTPYLVGHLGPAAYGLVPLAGLFTQYASIITSQLSASINRFLAVEIQKPDGDPGAIFNTSFALYCMLVLIQLPLFGAGLYYIDRIFSIPDELKADALLLLLCGCVSYLIAMVGAVFNVSHFSRNRLDIGSFMNMFRVIGRLVLIMALFTGFGPKLRYIGYVDLFLTVLVFFASIYYWRKLTPELTFSFRLIDWSLMRPVFKMSFWSMFNNLGSLLYLRTDIWVINKFISPVAAGQYAAILVVANFVRQLAALFSNQLPPTITSYWANNDELNLRRLVTFSCKVLSWGLAFPVALICVFAEPILTLWLGDEFSGLGLLLVVLAIHLPINTSVLPIFGFHVASNTIKTPAVVTFVMGLTNLVVSYLLGVPMGLGALGVALATAIVLTAKNGLFAPLYAAHVLRIPGRSFLLPVWGGVLSMAAVWLVCQLFGALLPGEVTLLSMLAQACAAGFAAAGCFWFIGLRRGERGSLRTVAKGIFGRG